MSLLTAAFQARPRAEGWSVTDDRWYTRDLSGFIGGVAVSAETMMRCSTVFAAVRFKAAAWAMCPPSTYRKTSRGREEVASHPSQRVLRNPNPRQTDWRWRELMGVWMSTFGNAYCRAVPGPESFADQLWPMHPDVIRVVDQRPSGTLIYEYAPLGKPKETIGGERVLHFQDLSMDGISGMPMYKLIRNVVSIALLAERHEETFLKKGARVAGLIVPASPLTKEQRTDLKESINSDFGGVAQTGSLGILPHGVDLKPLSLGGRLEQRAELTDQNIGSILRFLGVPGVAIGWQGDKASTYASAEYFGGSAVTHSILPLLTNVEAEEGKFLLPVGSDLYVRHNLDVLLRASAEERYKAYGSALGSAPWLTVNEIRMTEDFDADPDPRHDEIRIPANLTPPAPDSPTPEPAPRRALPHDDGGQSDDAARLLPEPVAAIVADQVAQRVREAVVGVSTYALRLPGGSRLPEEPLIAQDEIADVRSDLARMEADAKLRQYAEDNAARVVRREVAAIAAKAPKFSRDKDGWRAWVLETYAKHAAHVAEVMRISADDARVYCDGQVNALLAHGASVAETWDAEATPRLIALALRESRT
jgi:HK97 family phage portal protein